MRCCCMHCSPHALLSYAPFSHALLLHALFSGARQLEDWTPKQLVQLPTTLHMLQVGFLMEPLSYNKIKNDSMRRIFWSIPLFPPCSERQGPGACATERDVQEGCLACQNVLQCPMPLKALKAV